MTKLKKTYYLFFPILLLTLNAYASNCYMTSIQEPTPFMGNNDEIFKTIDGRLWKVKYSNEYLYQYYPQVIICPGDRKLLIKGKSINIESISSMNHTSDQEDESANLVQSNIEGDFNGWDGDTFFKLTNGQIWQQAEYSYFYSYAYSPRVTINKNGSSYELKVEGLNDKIKVKRIK